MNDADLPSLVVAHNVFSDRDGEGATIWAVGTHKSRRYLAHVAQMTVQRPIGAVGAPAARVWAHVTLCYLRFALLVGNGGFAVRAVLELLRSFYVLPKRAGRI